MYRFLFISLTLLLTYQVYFPYAFAERVLVLTPTGSAEEAQRDDIEDAIFEALRTLAYEPVSEGTSTVDLEALPTNDNEMEALAQLQHVNWVLIPRVRSMTGGYELQIKVGWGQNGRTEEVTIEVRQSREQERLIETFRLLLRPEGIGQNGSQISGTDQAALEAEARAREEEAQRERERQAAEQTEQARLAAEQEAREQAEREAAEQAEQQEAEAWANRERYGQPLRMAAIGGLSIRPILNPPDQAPGRTLASLDFRFGYSLPRLPGFEMRFGGQVVFGAAGGIALTAGAVYLVSPFTNTPIHIGAILEGGLFQPVTGNRVPSFLLRAGPLVSWHVHEKVWLEGSFPTLEILSANGGVVTLGVYLGAGTRF